MTLTAHVPECYSCAEQEAGRATRQATDPAGTRQLPDAAVAGQLSEAQVELLARFRCSKWQDEKALPPLHAPVTSPLKRRSARIRTAPTSFTPFFGRRR